MTSKMFSRSNDWDPLTDDEDTNGLATIVADATDDEDIIDDVAVPVVIPVVEEESEEVDELDELDKLARELKIAETSELEVAEEE